MADVEQDPWRWSKFFDFTPQRFGKDHAIGMRLVIIIAFYVLAGFGAYSLWQQIHAKGSSGTVAPSRVSGDSTINSGGGEVKTMDVQSTQSETRSTSTTVTNMPFANGILGVFGSQFKTQGNEDRKESK